MRLGSVVLVHVMIQSNIMIGICHNCNQDSSDVSYVEILLKNKEKKTVLLCKECKEKEHS